MPTIDIEFPGGQKVNALVKGFTVKTDQDVRSGGEGSAPDPFTYFLSSLAACAGFYAKSFCDQREITTEGLKLKMDTVYNPEGKMMQKFILTITVPAVFPEKYENALIQSVGLCAVKRHLSEKIAFETVISR